MMLRALIIVLTLLAGPAWSVEPDEMLTDPQLEARAQGLDMELRCVQCVSESIASSNASWARDARLMVRELISEGASDDEVLTFFSDRYGDVVLLRPRSNGGNLLLWMAGPLMAVLALLVGWRTVRSRGQAAGAAPLSEADQARLDEILKN